MRLDDYEKAITDTARKDWTWISCWGSGSGPSFLNKFTVWTTGKDEFQNLQIDSHGEYASLKANLAISFAYGLKHNDDFIEDWANKFSDPHASSSYIDFFFNGVMVYRDIYVTVDGGRCMLPLPRIEDRKESSSGVILCATKQRLAFFRMIQGDNVMFDSYLQRSGITTASEAWMA